MTTKKDNYFSIKINFKEISEKFNFQYEIQKLNEISYYDENRKKIICFISNFDIKNLDKYHCYWCTLPLKDYCNIFISAPIRFIPCLTEISQKSLLNKEIYSIKENIFSSHEYYESEGIFCHFSCCKSYLEKKKNKLSLSLLNEIWDKINNNSNELISAPHWKTLEIYGGKYSIKEYREILGSIVIKYEGKISFYPIGTMFSEKKKLPITFSN